MPRWPAWRGPLCTCGCSAVSTSPSRVVRSPPSTRRACSRCSRTSSCTATRRHPRERLAVLFWPDSEESQARTNLRQALHHLRRACPTPSASWRARREPSAGGRMRPSWLDVAEFEQLVARRRAGSRGRRRAASAPERGGALRAATSCPSATTTGSCRSASACARRSSRAAERLAELLELEREYRAAIPWARRLLDDDPLNEAACRRLMRLHALGGDRAAALRVYHGCATALAREAGRRAERRDPRGATSGCWRPRRLARPRTRRARPAARRSSSAGAQEWETLRRTWQRAAEGEALLAVIAGEAGIGKRGSARSSSTGSARQGIVAADSRCYSAAGAPGLRADRRAAALRVDRRRAAAAGRAVARRARAAPARAARRAARAARPRRR